MIALKFILYVLGFLLLWQVLIRIVRRLHHFPAPSFIGRFLDSRYRRWLQPPDKVISRSGIREGMTVLELGCGSGAFTTFAVRAVGGEGRLYALDIQRDMLKQLRRKLARPENRALRNIGLVQAGAYYLPFRDGSFDAVYLVTVLQEIPDKDRALWEIKRVLKTGGILAVTEFLPDPDYPLSSTTIRMGEQAGLAPEGKSGNLWNYTVRFRKPG